MQDGRMLFLDLRNPVSVPYLLEGDFPPEKVETQLVRKLVHRGDTVVDVGANVGWYTSLLCKLVGQRGEVHAFEPNPHLAKPLGRLSDRFAQLRVHRAAVSAEKGHAEFYIPDNWISGSLAAEDTENATCHRVPTTPLAEALRTRRVDFVKLDAEGAETQVLAGAANIVDQARAPIWLVELSSEEAAQFGCHPSEILEIFRRASRARYFAYGIDQKQRCLTPLRLPDEEPFWLNGLFVPARRLGRLPERWLPASTTRTARATRRRARRERDVQLPASSRAASASSSQ
jgi:FkbM family methyltransferase